MEVEIEMEIEKEIEKEKEKEKEKERDEFKPIMDNHITDIGEVAGQLVCIKNQYQQTVD